MSESEPTAHEILASHVTNVPEVTARVIRRACEEHAALQALCAEARTVTCVGCSYTYETSDPQRRLQCPRCGTYFDSKARVKTAEEFVSLDQLMARADELVDSCRQLTTDLSEAVTRMGGTCQKSNGRRPTTSRK